MIHNYFPETIVRVLRVNCAPSLCIHARQTTLCGEKQDYFLDHTRYSFAKIVCNHKKIDLFPAIWLQLDHYSPKIACMLSKSNSCRHKGTCIDHHVAKTFDWHISYNRKYLIQMNQNVGWNMIGKSTKVISVSVFLFLDVKLSWKFREKIPDFPDPSQNKTRWSI